MTKARPGSIRILAFSDLHGNDAALRILARKAKKADIVICAGDFTVFEHNILRVMRKLDALGKPVVLVNGNHEDEALVAEICRTLRNVTFIHRKVYRDSGFPGYAFAGHGGEGFAHISEDFEQFSKASMKKLLAIKKEGIKIVFATHQPPHNTKLDYIWAHHGSKSYSRFVKKIQPALHVCGHLHETQGKKDRIGKTLVINPGPKGKIVEV
ncbi:TPA: hypothetical protein HA231_04945 [Candidatus Woesearchaeota archaeon]|nr:hypothetical protein [Candidatus Woesearchaeota archaeon]